MVALSVPPSVLIADGDPYIGRVLEAKLVKTNQFRVTIATSGPDAMQAALQQAFSILLWDVRMRDTARLLPRLRALCPQAAFLLMTTDDRPVVDAEIARLGIAGVMVKPFGLDTLVERLNMILTTKPDVSLAAAIDLARVGQAISLHSPAGSCETRVLESSQDTFAVVGSPRASIPDDFAVGLRLRIQIRGEDALYSFPSRVVRCLSTPVMGWELQMPRFIRREQRRKSVRYPLTLSILIQEEAALSAPAISDAGLPLMQEGVSQANSVRGLTEDLSLGGCALIAATPLPVGTPVRFLLEKDIQGEGTITRVQAVTGLTTMTEAALPRQRMVVQFTSLAQVSRKRLRTLLTTNR